MDNSINRFTNDLDMLTEPANAPYVLSNNETSSGFFSEISLTTWLIIILVLSFLGFNIFVYLAKGTETLTDITGWFLKMFGKIFGGITGEIVDVSAEGAKGVVSKTSEVVDVTAKNINATLTSVQDAIPNENIDKNSLNKALNTKQYLREQDTEYTSDDINSEIQTNKKSGWCYIGEDRGIRSCSKVGANDFCVSGDIFPTHDICVNPNLRS